MVIRRMMGVALLACILFATVSCRRNASPPVNVAAIQESVILSTDRSCQQAVQSKSADQVIDCFTQNAVWMLPNLPPVRGHNAILSEWRKLFLNSNLDLSWQTTDVAAARSGDIGYSLYTYRLTTHPNNSKQTIAEHGSGLAVWKRQPDGKWKMSADVLSSDALPLSSVSR